MYVRPQQRVKFPQENSQENFEVTSNDNESHPDIIIHRTVIMYREGPLCYSMSNMSGTPRDINVNCREHSEYRMVPDSSVTVTETHAAPLVPLAPR